MQACFLISKQEISRMPATKKARRKTVNLQEILLTKKARNLAA